MDELSQLIHRSVGPSGRNKASRFSALNPAFIHLSPNQDYLYELAAAIKHLSTDSRDPYLEALEARVRALDSVDFRVESSPALQVDL